MANKALFKSAAKVIPVANTKNNAGGVAYSLSDAETVAQYAATCVFGSTYYTNAKDQLTSILPLIQRLPAELIAKIALYSRGNAQLKDFPALLMAVLVTKDTALFHQVFPRVIDNGRMLRNFVQVMRSGTVGRKSLGKASKRAVQAWLNSKNDDYIFDCSVGNDPSLKDVILMAHPKAETKSREALYKYILGHEYNFNELPKSVQDYENFKNKKSNEVPKVNFQMLTALELGTEGWTKIAKDAKWQMTRMNLNTFARHGVFNSKAMIKLIADRLKDKEQVHKSRQYPYQIFTSLKNTSEVPMELNVALQEALTYSLDNVPEFEGSTAVLIDVSGSMGSGIGGSSTSCLDAAALFASAILKKNPAATIITFDTSARLANLNPMDSVMTNAKAISARLGGGTSISCGVEFLMKHLGNKLADNVVIISDNESWADRGSYYGGGTGLMSLWTKYKGKNNKAKMVLIDITPNQTSQASASKDILRVGGFNDTVFDVTAAFFKQNQSATFWVDHINETVAL